MNVCRLSTVRWNSILLCYFYINMNHEDLGLKKVPADFLPLDFFRLWDEDVGRRASNPSLAFFCALTLNSHCLLCGYKVKSRDNLLLPLIGSVGVKI